MLSADTRKGGTSAQNWSKPSSKNASFPPLNIEGAKSTRVKYLKSAEINLCFLPPVESLLFLPPKSLGPPRHCPAPPCCQALSHSNEAVCCWDACRTLLALPFPCVLFSAYCNSVCAVQWSKTLIKELHYPLPSLTCMCIITTSLTTQSLTLFHFFKHPTLNACSTLKAHPHSTWSF